MSRSMLIRTGAQLPTKAEDISRVDERELQPKGTKVGAVTRRFVTHWFIHSFEIYLLSTYYLPSTV